ncbi:MAG TPA: hypothetical protein VL752_01115 [Acidisoma sp.]|jgi:hypothetical protein|uniref:hypothetical protein n=1 Tax=Acidisoma sp. TaxID=1872115 RepID=UPI002B69173B|nr:hypothetical protein [Acidisoma sp.]HTH99516.1 hypothetical protein [Acidisoma sp.]
MHIVRRGSILAIFLFGLAGCTVQLAPDYDAGLIEGINKANADTLVLFVSLQKGVTPQSFPDFETRYDAAIGSFSALRTQAEARFVPPLSQAFVRRIKATAIGANSSFGEICQEDTDCINPTPKMLDSIIGTLTEVEAVHKRKGFPAASAVIAGTCGVGETAQAASIGVMQYECSYLHDVEEALFVETSLKRE